MSMFTKYHNHTLQTNTRHRDEEAQNTNCHKTPVRQGKTIKVKHPAKMIAKTRKTQSPTSNGSNNKH